MAEKDLGQFLVFRKHPRVRGEDSQRYLFAVKYGGIIGALLFRWPIIYSTLLYNLCSKRNSISS
jgi:hypothetical protein